MIVAENWPVAPPEMIAGYVKLVEAVGAIPTHQEVTFEPHQRVIMTYVAMDHTLAAAGQQLGLTPPKVNRELRGAYDQIQGSHGGNRFQKLSHLTYVGLSSRSVPYPDFSSFRPDLTVEEGVVLLGLASRQSSEALRNAMGYTSGAGYRLESVTYKLHEKMGAKTNPGIVGRGFMFGFFRPSVDAHPGESE